MAATAKYTRESEQVRHHLRGLAAAALTASALAMPAAAEDITLRVASGHATALPYAGMMNTFLVPEIKKRVAERTKHKVNIIEGYGGAMVKVSDTLEGVQSGIVDIGGFCFCFEPSGLPLHTFQAMVPFGSMSPVVSLKTARSVVDQVPYMSKRFEDAFGQILLALIANNGYDIVTTFDWNTVGDLKNKKIAGAGLNLKWLEYAGVVGVQSAVGEGYTSMQTGVYQGWIMVPSAVVNFKWYEVAKHYTEIGFGSITWHGITVNKSRWAKLPKEVQDIILEVSRDYENLTGTWEEENYPKHLVKLKELGTVVKQVPDSVKQEWAKSLAGWPQEKATELDKLGLPGSQVLKLTISESEKFGHKWPIRYDIK